MPDIDLALETPAALVAADTPVVVRQGSPDAMRVISAFPLAFPGRFYYFTDFLSITADQCCSVQQTGTGAASTTQPWQFAGNPTGSGFIRVALGTTATGRSAWFSTILITFYPRIGALFFRIRGRLMNLSDATNTYTAWLGMPDVISAAPTNGIFFRYTHSVNGGRWQAVCRNTGVETAVDTGIAGSTSADQTFEIRGSADGATFTFYIDDALVATITTNLPAVGTTLGFGYNFIRSAGTAAFNAAAFDYLAVSQDYPSRT